VWLWWVKKTHSRELKKLARIVLFRGFLCCRLILNSDVRNNLKPNKHNSLMKKALLSLLLASIAGLSQAGTKPRGG
jgi:hypothetical protein